jgi:hypothetical protein
MSATVSDLSGVELAYWVAKAEGLDPEVVFSVCMVGDAPYAPHEDWAQGGPLWQKHVVACHKGEGYPYVACRLRGAFGATYLEAMCRAILASSYGEDSTIADIEDY